MLINIIVTGILKNQVRESSKQGIQADWSTPIHHFKWWISRFRDAYRTHKTSEMELIVILINCFRPLYNVTKSSVLVVGVLDLPLHFIITIIIVIILTIIINIIFMTVIITRIFDSLLFLWGKLTVWFCFLRFLHLSYPDRRDHHLVLTHCLNIIIWHHLLMVKWRQRA